MKLKTMFSPQKDSPATTLDSAITETTTAITVVSAAQLLPSLPSPLTLGVGEFITETVLVTAISGNQLTVTRGFYGDAKAWPADTQCARVLNADDIEAMQNNILAVTEFSKKALSRRSLLEDTDFTQSFEDTYADIAVPRTQFAAQSHSPIHFNWTITWAHGWLSRHPWSNTPISMEHLDLDSFMLSGNFWDGTGYYTSGTTFDQTASSVTMEEDYTGHKYFVALFDLETPLGSKISLKISNFSAQWDQVHYLTEFLSVDLAADETATAVVLANLGFAENAHTYRRRVGSSLAVEFARPLVKLESVRLAISAEVANHYCGYGGYGDGGYGDAIRGITSFSLFAGERKSEWMSFIAEDAPINEYGSSAVTCQISAEWSDDLSALYIMMRDGSLIEKLRAESIIKDEVVVP
jgi:hypothetical protein